MAQLIPSGVQSVTLWREDGLCLCVRVKSRLCCHCRVCLFACIRLSLCTAGRGSLWSARTHTLLRHILAEGWARHVHIRELSVCHCCCCCGPTAASVTVVQRLFFCLFVRVWQGLFRIAAGASKLKKLKAALDCSTSQLEEFYSDPHAVAGLSQKYFFVF